jgi:hypothetical protein
MEISNTVKKQIEIVAKTTVNYKCTHQSKTNCFSSQNNQPEQSQSNQNVLGVDQLKNTVNINMNIMNKGMPIN